MEVAGFLGRLRSRLRAVLIAEGLARVLAYALAACVAAVLIDYVFRLPAPLRFGLLIAIAVAVVVTVRRRLARPLGQPMDDRSLASLIERRIPALDGRLLSGIDGIALSEIDRRSLAELLSPATARALVPARAMPWYVAAAAGVVMVVAIIALTAPQFLASGASRLFLPFGATTWQRSDTLEGRVLHPVVPADEPLVVEIRRIKGGSSALHLAWTDVSRPGIGDKRTLDGLEGPWRHPLNLPPGTWRIEAWSGDAEPLTLSGRVVARPRLAEVRAVLTPPAYVQGEAQELSTLTCTALPGSVLDLAVGFDMEEDRTAEAIVLTLAGETVAAERDARGLRGRITVTKGGELVVGILDQDGIGAKPEPRFTITLAEDRAPVVALDGARNNEAVTPRARLTLRVDARDDIGLGSLALDAQRVPAAAEGSSEEPKPGERRTLAQFPEVSGFATTRPHALVVGDQAAIGERLLLIGIAKDLNDVSGPGIGESEPLQLRVVSEEELRRELDRLIADARERVSQARDELGRGLAKKDQLPGASRNAGLAARKAGELLGQVGRRWRDNQLPEDQAVPVVEAARLIDVEATPKLAEVPGAGERGAPLAETADKALGEAERLLAGLIQDGDLGRELASVLARERALHDESKDFAREFLGKPLDDAGRLRQESLGVRQGELAEQMKAIERKLLASTARQMQPAQDTVRSEQPADTLSQAARDLASKEQRPKGIERQLAAIAAMEKLLAQLQGSDAAKSMAEQAGALARDQEALAQELEQGTPPGELRERQQKLAEKTAELLEQVQEQGQSEEAAKSLQGANQSQGGAEQSMQKGDRSGAAREASSAAAQLREAQRQLEGENEQKEKEKDKRNADIMALLKELRAMQIKVVNDSTTLHQRLGDKPLDFAGKRDLAVIAELQSEVALRLTEEGMKELEGHAIALIALKRVQEAIDKAVAHLETPALGERGLRLEKTALHELNRLIEIAEDLPDPDDSEQEGNGQGNGQQAPFPPQAEMALLRAMQDELAMRTAANAPMDLTTQQGELKDLVATLEEHVRPGSRAAVLLSRTGRAMASSHYLLGESDRGLTTRHEQEAAVAALTRLMQEAKRSGGKNDQPQQNQQQDRQDGKPSGTPQGGGQSGAAGAGAQGSGTTDKPGTPVMGEGVDGGAALMHLPPEARERLQQARDAELPPGALPLFQRYLEELGAQP
ncbi:MAG TPA: hypothetical protein VEL07_03250 [Planctomycetota bacterium]|nr:hypothetical protein [Planctomycetota bacterium]